MLNISVRPGLRKQDIGMLPRLRVLIIGAFPHSLYFRFQPAQTQIERGSRTNKGKKGYVQ